jgi:mannose-6-phosphate isomerase-like protein (cupin superfamily)
MQRLTGLFAAPPDGELGDFIQHLVVPDLSVGTYSIPAYGVDDQTPHRQDEIYVVIHGRARLTTPDGDVPVGPGDVLYVPVGEEHRFVDITENLSMLVVFAPAYRGS